jgi:hypothetical protein
MEDKFFPVISRFMDASPKEFISELNKVFLMVWRLKLDEALAAYQTINTLMCLRGSSLDKSEIHVVTELRDKAILGRLITIEALTTGDMGSTRMAIEAVTGKKFNELCRQITKTSVT